MRLREQQDLTGAPLAALLPRLEAAAGGGDVAGEADRGGSRVKPTADVRRPAPAADGDGLFRRPAAGGAGRSPVARRSAGRRSRAEPTGGDTVRVSAESWTPSWPATANCWWPGGACNRASRKLAALREFVGRWKAEWRAVEKPLAQFLRDAEPAKRRGPAPCRPRGPRRGAGPRKSSAASPTTCARWRRTWNIWPPAWRRTAACSRRRPAPSTTRCAASGCCPSPRPARGWTGWCATWRRRSARRWSWSSKGATWNWIGRCWRG